MNKSELIEAVAAKTGHINKALLHDG